MLPGLVLVFVSLESEDEEGGYNFLMAKSIPTKHMIVVISA